MERLFTLFGTLAAIGLAFLTAGMEMPNIAHSGDSNRRGRLEFRHAVPEISLDDVTNALGGVADGSGGTDADTEAAIAAAAADRAAAAAAASAADPVAAVPDPVTIEDVNLCPVPTSEWKNIGTYIHIQIDEEGNLFWVTSSGRSEVESAGILKRKFDAAGSRTVVIVPDQWTNWQSMKDALDAAYNAAMSSVYIGVCDESDPTTLRLVHVVPNSPSTEAPTEDIFHVKIFDEDDALALEVNGEKSETFPADLAVAWGEWKKGKDVDTTLVARSPVVLNIHRFTPMEHVAPVLSVLRGLGIETANHTGAVWKRKR